MTKYEFKGTPGPWVIERSLSGYPYRIHAPNGSDGPGGIKDVTRWAAFSCPSLPEGEANARLIAAAPELLEALLPFADHAEDRCADSPEWDSHNSVTITVTIGDLRAARAALSRALGEDE